VKEQFMKRIGIVLGVFLMLAAAAHAQQPVVNKGGVVNAASYALAGLPNAGIPQGGMFIVFGTNLGPASLTNASSFPLPTDLAGTSIRVTVSGTTTQAIMLYTSAGQVAAVLRSNTPIGTGTLVLTRNGSASAPVSITVVQASFGAFTINQAGTGAGILTNASNQPITALNPAAPGQIVILWGTGLGPISGDETQPPAQGNLSTSVQVLVGVSDAEVVYKGRAGCCAGLDQINFVVPAGLSGCTIPVLVRINNVVSNSSTLAVSNSGPCSDPNGLSQESLQRLQSQGNLRIGSAFLTRVTSFEIPGIPNSATDFESASGVFSQVDQTALLQSQGSFNQVSIGGCVVVNFSGQSASAPKFPNPIPLDAGATLSVNGPNGLRQIPKLAAPAQPHTYFLELRSATGSQPSYMTPGAYTLSGPGGADVGPFQASFNIADRLTWTNSTITNVNRSQNLIITWTGGPTGSNIYIVIGGYSVVLNTTDNTSFGAYFYCLAPNTGQFTIPSAVLLALPPSSTVGVSPFVFPLGSIYVGAYLFIPFTASGLDQGYAGYTETFGKSLSYQ
jgi:uncharacterized protein (TIGR03437 family)